MDETTEAGPLNRIVIVGSGQAGVELAAALRQRDFAGSVTVVGDELDLPYQRPPLSKHLFASHDEVPLPLKGGAFYTAKDIDLRLGVRAESIDRTRRLVLLSDGGALPYDHLAIATGARNRIPPIPGLQLQEILELRTVPHARALFRRIEGASHVAIVGGGFIGLEIAGLLRARGIGIDLVEAAGRLMGRVLSEPMSDYFRHFHEAMGTRLHFGRTVREIEHFAGSAKLVLSDGATIETDLVLLAAGVVPNVELAAAAGLASDNGIVVDNRLVTSDPAISALGDCAAHPNTYASGMVRLESVQNAIDQARCVAVRLTGEDKPYDSLPWFWSNQGSARLQIAGLGTGHDDAVLRGDCESGKFSAFLYAGDRLLAVESVNSPADHMIARRLLSARVALPKAAAADSALDLKSLLPATRA